MRQSQRICGSSARPPARIARQADNPAVPPQLLPRQSGRSQGKQVTRASVYTAFTGCSLVILSWDGRPMYSIVMFDRPCDRGSW